MGVRTADAYFRAISAASTAYNKFTKRNGYINIILSLKNAQRVHLHCIIKGIASIKIPQVRPIETATI